VILLSVVAGGALFGITGTVLAVPVVAVGVNASKSFRRSGPGDLVVVTDDARAGHGSPPS
jgi:predicted PurR-regulated permease PerM